MRVNREQVEWLRTLIASHKELTESLREQGFPDEDPSATSEMYSECEALAAGVVYQLDLADSQENARETHLTDEQLDRGRYPDDVPF